MTVEGPSAFAVGCRAIAKSSLIADSRQRAYRYVGSMTIATLPERKKSATSPCWYAVTPGGTTLYSLRSLTRKSAALTVSGPLYLTLPFTLSGFTPYSREIAFTISAPSRTP